MPRRLLQLLLVPLLLVAGACGDAVSPGLRVGDRTVGHDELIDEMGEWAGNDALEGQFLARFGPAPGSYSTELSSAVLRFRIQRELVNGEFDARDLQVRREHREQAPQVLYGDPQTAAQIEAGFSRSYAEDLLADTARELAVVEELGDQEFIQWLSEAASTTRIEVSSRFGEWDPQLQQVVPPSGPATTTTAITAPPVPPGAETGVETAP